MYTPSNFLILYTFIRHPFYLNTYLNPNQVNTRKSSASQLHTHIHTHKHTSKLNRLPARCCSVLNRHTFLSWQMISCLTPWKCYEKFGRPHLPPLSPHYQVPWYLKHEKLKGYSKWYISGSSNIKHTLKDSDRRQMKLARVMQQQNLMVAIVVHVKFIFLTKKMIKKKNKMLQRLTWLKRNKACFSERYN